jgi:hypothetical protein
MSQMARIQDKQGKNTDTFIVVNAACFSSSTMVARMLVSETSYVRCLTCYYKLTNKCNYEKQNQQVYIKICTFVV